MFLEYHLADVVFPARAGEPRRRRLVKSVLKSMVRADPRIQALPDIAAAT